MNYLILLFSLIIASNIWGSEDLDYSLQRSLSRETSINMDRRIEALQILILKYHQTDELHYLFGLGLNTSKIPIKIKIAETFIDIEEKLGEQNCRFFSQDLISSFIDQFHLTVINNSGYTLDKKISWCKKLLNIYQGWNNHRVTLVYIIRWLKDIARTNNIYQEHQRKALDILSSILPEEDMEEFYSP